MQNMKIKSRNKKQRKTKQIREITRNNTKKQKQN